MNRPMVFVVILNWNLKDDTLACVESVLAGSYTQQRVVVVDNGSQDGSALAIAERFGDAVDLIVNEKNVGFAAGVNRGIRYALDNNTDFVLLLNNDTIVASDMVERLIAAADGRPHIGILGPAIFRYDQPGRVWRLGDRHLRWLPIPIRLSDRALQLQEEILPVDYVTGCGMLIRRQVFSTIGLFNPGYFMYYEDADFCRRAIKAGFSIACVPAARMWHKISASTRENVIWQRYLRTRSRVQFYRYHYSLPAWIYLSLDTLWEMLADISRGKWRAALACAKGFYQGWQLDQDSKRILVRKNGNGQL